MAWTGIELSIVKSNAVENNPHKNRGDPFGGNKSKHLKPERGIATLMKVNNIIRVLTLRGNQTGKECIKRIGGGNRVLPGGGGWCRSRKRVHPY